MDAPLLLCLCACARLIEGVFAELVARALPRSIYAFVVLLTTTLECAVMRASSADWRAQTARVLHTGTFLLCVAKADFATACLISEASLILNFSRWVHCALVFAFGGALAMHGVASLRNNWHSASLAAFLHISSSILTRLTKHGSSLKHPSLPGLLQRLCPALLALTACLVSFLISWPTYRIDTLGLAGLYATYRLLANYPFSPSTNDSLPSVGITQHPKPLLCLSLCLTATSIVLNRALFQEFGSTSGLDWLALCLCISILACIAAHSVTDEFIICLPGSPAAPSAPSFLAGSSLTNADVNINSNPPAPPLNSLAARKPIAKRDFAVIAMFALVILPATLSYTSTFFRDNRQIRPHLVIGRKWASTLHQALEPDCTANVTTATYTKPLPKTAFASFPRSGNSWIRSLVERSTGFRTSSIYCDAEVLDTFKDDCDPNGVFFEKTHHPTLYGSAELGWRRYGRVVRAVRNPIDSIYSFWHFLLTFDELGIKRNHTARIHLDHVLGSVPEEELGLLKLASDWVAHDEYWSAVPLPQHVVLYENLRGHPFAHLTSLLAFFVPEEDLPPLEQIACALQDRSSLDPYASKKRAFFYAFDKLHPPVRDGILNITRKSFCKYGYEASFKAITKHELPFGSCADVWAPVDAGPTELVM